MKNIVLMLVALFCLASIEAHGQRMRQVDRSQELQIGQLVPDLPIQEVLNYNKNRLDIGQYKNKVVILDFFDTYCSNCIAAMPKLQKLQDELGDRLQVILVTWQDRETIERFYAKNAFLKKHKVLLPTICSDSLLRNLFPHTGVPHTAWLFQNKVQAVTHSDFVKRENIDLLYQEGQISLPQKSDFNDGLKTKVESFKSDRGSIQLSGYQDGVVTSGFKMEYDSARMMYKSSLYNVDILGAYTSVWSKIHKPKFILKEERIVWKVKDSTRYKYYENDIGVNEWIVHNGISYERYDGKERSLAEQAELVLQDINSFLGLNVYWASKPMTCLVITELSDKSSKSRTADEEGDIEGTGVLAFMIDYLDKFPPVVDEVNSLDKFAVGDFSTIEELNKKLKRYGLSVKEEIRHIEVLVFEEVE